MPRAARIGREGEHLAAKILRRLWPDANRDDVGKYDPYADLAHTGQWTVQVKRRATWNIKDVVRHMEDGAPEPWMIVYMDSDRRKKDNPSDVYAIMPLDLVVSMMAVIRGTEEVQYPMLRSRGH